MKRKRLKWRVAIILVFITLLVSGTLLYTQSIMPVIVLLSEENAKISTNKVLNMTAYDMLSGYYDDIVEINSGSESGLDYVKVNTARINEIALSLSLRSQEILLSQEYSSFSVPVGTLTGIVFFSNIGPEINVSIIPTNAVAYEYYTRLQTAGINQVNYKLVLKMKTAVNLIIPGANKRVDVYSDIVLVDCLFVGDVPSVYLNTTQVFDLKPS